jgi:hypothetical protein
MATVAKPALASELSAAEYRQQLQDLSAKVDPLKDHPEQLREFMASLPDHVSVISGSTTYSLSYDWLRSDLKDFALANAKRHTAIVENIEKHLHALDDQCAALENSQPNSGQDHQKLREILSRREFRRVHGPTAGEILLQRILRWIDRLLNDTDENGKKRVSPIKLAIYVIVGVAVIMLVVWTKRRFAFTREQALPREIMPFAPSARGWRVWLAEARKCAQQEDWRNSVHLAYWAAISFLEEHGAWKPDRARTPREYLDFLRPVSSHYPTMAALTRRFEVIWYGHQDAQQKDFQEALGQLEKLGCK